jgi:hypothetical protein
LLVGAILPLDLRLLGLFGHAPLAVLAPFLFARRRGGRAAGDRHGLWLFSVKPSQYAPTPRSCASWRCCPSRSTTWRCAANRHFASAIAGGAVRPTVRLVALGSILLVACRLLVRRRVESAFI